MIHNNLLEKAQEAKIAGRYSECISLAKEAIKQSDDLETTINGLLIKSCVRYYLLKQNSILKIKKIFTILGVKKDLDFVLKNAVDARSRISAMEIFMLFSSNEGEINIQKNLGIFEIENSTLNQEEQKSLIIELENAYCLALLKCKKGSSARQTKDKLLELYQEVPENNQVLAGIILKNAAICRLLIMQSSWCPTKKRDERLKAIELLNRSLGLYPAEEIAHIESAQNVLRMIA